MSLYFSYVFIVHKANVKPIRSWNIQGKKAEANPCPISCVKANRCIQLNPNG